LRVLVPFTRPVVYGRLVRRRKRFLVDVVLDDAPAGEEVTAHTANTGAMTGLLEEGARVMLTDHEGSARSLRYELEAIEVRGEFVSVNTISANAFAARAVELGLVEELAGYPVIRREVAPSPRSKSRLDFVLEHDTMAIDGRCFVEVKSVTLKDERRALFPDAVTERGKKHLDALARLVKKGERAAMLYVNKRPGCDVFRPAAAIDRAYATALRRAARAGVEVLCIDCVVDERGLSYGGRLTVDLT
jgi:sugar fermentation stimulation protein A